MNNPRPFQIEAAERVLAAMTKQRRILVVMPPGSGKTMVAQLIVKELLAANKPVTMLAYTRAEIEHARKVMHHAFGVLDAPHFQFVTSTQLVNAGRPASVSVSGHVVIAIDSSFSRSLKESTRIADALATAQTLIAFSSAPTEQDYAFYGEAVYTLHFQEALQQAILPPVNFHGLGNRVLGADPGQTEVDQALGEVMPLIGSGRTVFVCAFKAAVHAVHARLAAIKPAHIRIGRISSDALPEERDRARSADWIVGSAAALARHDIVGTRHVVLFNHFQDFGSLLHAVRFIVGNQDGHIWDLGDNYALWRQHGLEGEGASTDSAQPSDVVDADSDALAVQKWIRPRADGAASRDLMDRDRLIHVLRGIIRSKSEDRSLAIGVFGRWGSGKTSVINLLKQRLAGSKDILFIEFNAWENEQVSSMPAALADAITQQIYRQHKGLKRFWLLLKHRSMINEWALGAMLLVLATLLVSMIPIPKLDEKLEFSGLSFIGPDMRKVVTVVLTAICGVQFVWKSPAMQGLRSVLRQIGYAEHIGLARRLREDLAKLFEACRPGRGKGLLARMKKRLNIAPKKAMTYVLVIDDLDRCSRQNVWSVVEATRLVADFKDVVLVFAVDYRLLFDAIAERLHDKVAGGAERERLSREFLAKILQLSVQLPEPTNASVSRYIAEALFSGLNEGLAAPAGNAAASMPAAQATQDNEPDGDGDQPGPEQDEHDTIHEQSDEYIVSTPVQRTIFQECAAVFELTNPRTLLRLYNSLTLIKGMHPSVGDDEQAYRHHAFYVFLTELCAIHNQPAVNLEQLLSGSLDSAPGIPWKSVRDYAKLHEMPAPSQQSLDRVAQQRARTTSLPII